MPRFLAIALVLLVSCPAHAADKALERTFTVSPGGSLVVDADGASVRVSGSDTDKVTVRMKVRGTESELENITLDAAQNGNGVTATMKRPKARRWFGWGWTIESSIEVTVPRQYGVDVRTSGGNIELKDTVGSVKLYTSGGDVTAHNLHGNVWLRTSGGQITLDKVRGDVEAKTSGGDVRLLNIDGSIDGHTSGGSVRVSLVGANRGISATTSGGNVEVVLPPGTSGEVAASTSGGNVRTDIPVTTSIVKEGRLEGTLNGGGPRIKAHTSGGDVRLRAAG
jgi:DUF4097 and DUF4098 domain-containing protein YvlB